MLGPRDPSDYLLPTERRVIRLRRHWAWLAPVLLQSGIALAVLFVLSALLDGAGDGLWLVQSLLWYAALFVILRLAIEIWQWWIETIVVTDKRFLITSGIISTNVAIMPITKVTDISYKRPLIGRVLGYGTLVVESAGQNQAFERLEYLPRPEEVNDTISELLFGVKPQATAGPAGPAVRVPTFVQPRRRPGRPDA